MSNLTFAALWCAGQVMAVSLMALLYVQAVMKRRPELASRIAGWAVAVVLAVTVLIPWQLPSWMNVSPAGDRAARTTGAFAPESPTTFGVSPVGMQGSVSSPGFRIPLETLLRPVRSLRQSPLPVGSSIGFWLMIGLGIGIGLGLLRLAWGMLALRTLRHRALRLDDQELMSLVNSIQREWGEARVVTIAESAEIDCAAVMGIIRPLVLLSREWRSWSPDELRAVLAHELAHLHRRDPFWRIVAMLGSAIHFYNPLLRWLTSRLILAQELAADQLAMRTIGEPGNYLRSLSGLLLRQDTRTHVRSHTLMMPVFSGDWIRRIKMLRVMDDSQARPARGWASLLVLGAMAAFAIATTALRAYAQNEPAKSDPPVASPTPPREPVPEIGATLFRRPKVSASQPVFSNTGGMHLDLAGLRHSELLGGIIEGYLGLMTTPIDLDIHALDTLTADAKISLTYDPTKEKGSQNGIVIGATKGLLQSNRDIDWKAQITKFFPHATSRIENEQEQFELSIPVLGPVPVFFHPVGSRSLLIGLKPTPEAAQTPPWADEWDAVSGGVVTLVLPVTDIEKMPNFENDPRLKDPLMTLTRSVDLISLGSDVSDDGPMIETKVRLRCREAIQSGAVVKCLRELLPILEDSLDQQQENDSLYPDEVAMYKDAIRSLQITQPADAPRVVECRFRLELPGSVLTRAIKELHYEQSLIQQASEEQQPSK